MELNKPTCLDCASFGIGTGGTTPGIVPSSPSLAVMDRGKVSLTAGVNKIILLVNVIVLTSNEWVFSGQPLCYDSENNSIGYTIISRSSSGFVVQALENSTFEYTCIKL